MDKKTLTFKDAPRSYALCFNHDCERREECMHYYMGRLAPADRTRGTAIYPSACKDGQCPHFVTTEKVRFAWGFNGLYKNLPADKVTEARQGLRWFLGSGASAYYRIHNGEKLLTPARQQEILDFMANFCDTNGLEFDHYVTKYDFT